MHREIKQDGIVVRERPFRSLKRIWQGLYAANTAASPYASYEFARILRRAYAFELFYGGFPRFFVFYKGGSPIMIAPLTLQLGKNGWKYAGFGARFRLVSEEFIYGDSLSEDDMETCLRLLLSRVGHINFKFLSDSGLLYKVLKLRFPFPEVGNEINVMLRLPATYDEYIASLSKNMHQNIRTIYNRMKTDGFNYRFEIYRGADMPAGMYRRLLRLYSVSYRCRWNSSQRWWRKALFPVRVKYMHPNAMAINGIDESLCAVLFIDGKIAAMVGGYLQKNNDYLLLPREAFDERFSRYSPGIICFLETIRYLISQGIPLLDLSKGDETYKFSLGGEAYWQYGFDICKMD